MNKQELLALIAKHVNVPGLVEEAMGGIIDQALQKMVDDSSNPFDNMAKAALYPVLKKEVTELVAAKWAELLSE